MGSTLILLKQLNAHHGALALLPWPSSLPSLADDGAAQAGTLNPPEHEGGCTPDQAPKHPSALRGGTWVSLKHSEMLPSCGTFRREQDALGPASTTSSWKAPQSSRFLLSSSFSILTSLPLLQGGKVTKACLPIIRGFGVLPLEMSITRMHFRTPRSFFKFFS